MEEEDKCYEITNSGECCCNCKNLIELFKHPSNEIHKGSINDSSGIYACVLLLNYDEEQKGIISENKHGLCEMHTPK